MSFLGKIMDTMRLNDDEDDDFEDMNDNEILEQNVPTDPRWDALKGLIENDNN